MDGETALKISGPFGGGMAGTAQTCGVVTGAFMAIGLKYARTQAGDDETKQRCYAACHEFVARLKDRHGSTMCRELAGYDISTPEGKQQFHDQRVMETVCTDLIRSAAQFLEEIL